MPYFQKLFQVSPNKKKYSDGGRKRREGDRNIFNDAVNC
jgi:hypothetical protein